MRLVMLTLLLMAQLVDLQAQKTRKVVFVIPDGIPADVLEKLHPPTIFEIAGKSGYTRAYVGGERKGYSETPTISAVGYNSLLTGTWVNKHNVWDNDIKEPNFHYSTLFRFLEDARPAAKTAIFSTWLDNRTKLIGEGLAATGNIKLDHHFDGFELDTVRFPHDRAVKYIHQIDELVADSAARYIHEQAPDLTWVYLEYTDDMGHRFGDSKQRDTAVAYLDGQLKKIWEAIQYREKNFSEEWGIFITTDHGRDSISGKGHGGQSDRERSTWIVTNVKWLNPYFNNRPAIVDVFAAIASYLQIPIPREQKMEIDGVSFIGNIEIASATARLENNRIFINWRAYEKKGKAKIWVTGTNNFRNGGTDEYKLMMETDITKQAAVVDVSKFPSSFYKIVIETQSNFLNRWIINKK